MIKITAAQRRKIFILAKEYGLDNDLLHTYIFNLVGKKSIKKLNVLDAIKIIDSFEDRQKAEKDL